jgi:redox-regulated HSP33 family molecular chaperone
LHQLPPLPGKDEYEFSPQAVRSRREKIRGSVSEIFARGLSRREEIGASFGGIGFRLLADRPIRFRCSCSRMRMIENLQPVYRREGAGLFDAGSDRLEVVCEYCKSRYHVERRELEVNVNRSH